MILFVSVRLIIGNYFTAQLRSGSGCWNAVVLICTAVFQRKNLVTDERGPLENGASVI